MERVILFNLLQVAATVYALRRGGAPERLIGASLLIATLLTRALQTGYPRRFGGVEWSVMAVDVCLLAVLLAVALHADRFWTMWVAALHALGTGAHLVKLLDQEVLRFAYALLAAIWSYPMLGLLVFGTARHVRRSRTGTDPDWSFGRPTRKV